METFVLYYRMSFCCLTDSEARESSRKTFHPIKIDKVSFATINKSIMIYSSIINTSKRYWWLSFVFSRPLPGMLWAGRVMAGWRPFLICLTCANKSATGNKIMETDGNQYLIRPHVQHQSPPCSTINQWAMNSR